MNVSRSVRCCWPASGLALVLAALLPACYADRQVTLVNQPSLHAVTTTAAPTKVFLSDASIVLFPGGFTSRNGFLEGSGVRFPATARLPSQEISYQEYAWQKVHVPKDSAIAMTYYEEVTTGGRKFASVFHGLTGGVFSVLAVYCLSDPKACFGSCPTVYERRGPNWEFKAELFSYSISKLLESWDIDRIGPIAAQESTFALRVANEALETHHINVMRLVSVRHATGTLAFPCPDGSVVAVSEVCEPISAVNSEREDVTARVRSWDDVGYRSDSLQVRKIREGKTADWIDLKVRVEPSQKSPLLLLRLKNTLLSTVLFYEIVLGSQGIQAIDWTQRMNTDLRYASQFKQIYDAFSGVRVRVLKQGEWKTLDAIPDVGPVGWKPIAVRLPVQEECELVVRLEFFPDNVAIDYVGFASEGTDITSTEVELSPYAVFDGVGALRPDVSMAVATDDDRYLVTEPRDVYRFRYEIPAATGEEITFFVRSKGYYTEWIRGSWITRTAGDDRFELYRIDRTMTSLADLWLRERASMETLFFRNRIPVAEDI